MNIQEEQLYERVMERIDLTREMEDEELSEIIYSVLQEFSEEEYLPLKEQIRLSRRLFHSFRKLDVLQELVEDDSITEIMINGKDHIFVERDGRIVRSDKTFLSQEKLEDVIQQIVSGTNRYVNELSPIVDARLEDGSRVNVVLKPVALNGPIMTIRKFPKEKVTMKQLVEWQSITEEAVEFLKMLVNLYTISICHLGWRCKSTSSIRIIPSPSRGSSIPGLAIAKRLAISLTKDREHFSPCDNCENSITCSPFLIIIAWYGLRRTRISLKSGKKAEIAFLTAFKLWSL